MLRTFLTLGLAAMWSWTAAVAWAQASAKMPKPETVRLVTKDGVILVATFYDGRQGKETVPVLLVHDLKGSRADFHFLALRLQQQGFSVLVPDLRGHGESRRLQNSDRVLSVDRFRPRHYPAFLEDLETCKRFLLQKNNRGELNIDKLCLVGAKFGAVVATLWAHRDWQWPPLATGKQGQDVKALVLISPERKMHGMDMTSVLSKPVLRWRLAVYVIVGGQNPEYRREAEKVYESIFKVRRKRMERDPHYPRVAFTVIRTTRLQGTDLFRLKGSVPQQLADRIAQFLDAQVRQRSIPWQDRTNPLAEAN